MTQKEFARLVSRRLKEKGVRKAVGKQKYVLHISDDEGNSKDFIAKKDRRKIMFTTEDIEAIITAAIEVAIEAVGRGDTVTYRGFGSLYLKYVKPRLFRNINNGEMEVIPDHHVPGFKPGVLLYDVVKMYDLQQNDRKNDEEVAKIEQGYYDDDDEDAEYYFDEEEEVTDD